MGYSKLCWRCNASSKAAGGSNSIALLLLDFRHGSLAEGVGSNMASRYYQEMQESFRNNSKSREFPAHSAKVHSVAWSCDGRRLASGSFDKTASVFVLEKDRLVSPANVLMLQLAPPQTHTGRMDSRWSCAQAFVFFICWESMLVKPFQFLSARLCVFVYQF